MLEVFNTSKENRESLLDSFLNHVALQIRECLDNLDSCYTWPVPIPAQSFSSNSSNHFRKFVEDLQQNINGLNHVNDVIMMRKIFSYYANEINLNDVTDENVCFLRYVVEGWGKISISQRRQAICLSHTYKDLMMSLQEEKIKRISSWSKVRAACDPRKYFVYDSRVSFVLNALWIDCFDRKVNCPFPLLETRNTKLKKLKRLIQVKENKKVIEDFSYSSDYCSKFVLPLSEFLGVASEPQKIEMALFAFVGTKAFRDLVDRL